MLDRLFSFRGRLDRLRYFLTSLALFGVTFALLVAGLMTFVFGHHGFSPSSLLPLILMCLVAAPAQLWISFSLQARRFRDMGWDPVLVIPAWIVILMLDRGVASAFPSLSVSKAIHQTVFAGVGNLLMVGCLLFWPSKTSDGQAPPDLFAPDLFATDPSPPVSRPPPSRPIGPTQGPVTGVTFGRRGL